MINLNTFALVLIGAVLNLSGCAPATQGSPAAAQRSRPLWSATWAPSQSATPARPAAGTPDPVPTYVNATIRQIVHTTVGGDNVRIRISNEYGDRPIVIGSAHIALRAGGSSIAGATDKALLFGGRETVTVRPGSVITSDPLGFAVPQLGDIVISMYLPDSSRTTTRHSLGVQSTYVSKAGNSVSSATFATDTTLRSWVFLSAVEVTNPRVTGTIVTVGNSITDGYGATVDMNHRWPDILASRLLSSGSEPVKAVVNAGISGNRVTTFGAGPSLVARFDRDVLMQPGVTHVIILEGINDISGSATTKLTAADIIFGLKQVADRARERGIIVYGATLTPFERVPPEREAMRQAVNAWIRTGGAYDGVIDFDMITRDPSKPDRFLPAYDSGDHLHPGDAGYLAMGQAIDLALFRGATARRK